MLERTSTFLNEVDAGEYGWCYYGGKHLDGAKQENMKGEEKTQNRGSALTRIKCCAYPNTAKAKASKMH